LTDCFLEFSHFVEYVKLGVKGITPYHNVNMYKHKGKSYVHQNQSIIQCV